MPTLAHRLEMADAALHRSLVARSMALLRVSLGLVFLGFGLLKFFPGVSPAESLVMATTDELMLGLVSGGLAVVLVGALECTIGMLLITGRGTRTAIYLLAGQFVGILSPLVLLPGRLFAGPSHAPTLEGQYVLKDVILVAAVLVVATTLRGGRIARGDHSAALVSLPLEAVLSADAKLAIVMEGVRGDRPLADVCAAHGITPDAFQGWRRDAADGARRILARQGELAGV